MACYAMLCYAQAHRDILTSDIVHLRRPTGESIDGFLHVNPKLPLRKALAMFFNPTAQPLSAAFALPLYYSGLDADASVSVGGGAPARRTLSRFEWAMRSSATWTMPPAWR